jgi:hypothetical protein
VRRHLAPAAREWDAAGRPGDELYRGARLAAALDWAADDVEVTAIEQAFLDASRETAQAELIAAQRRADRETAARHRTRRLATGLAAVLAVALVATVLAVTAQRSAQEASRVADANRLAALSTTVGRLDLSLLLAAQAVRLADTPETQDGLLVALSDHGRAERVVSFDGLPYRVALADRGRTLFVDAGTTLSARDIGFTTPPRTVVTFPTDPAGPLAGWRIGAPSPMADALLGVGENQGSVWVRLVGADGSLTTVAEWPSVDGFPVGGGFSADGRKIELILAVADPGGSDGVSRWNLVEIALPDGVARDTGVGGAIAAPVEDLAAAVDAGSAVLWDVTGAADPVVIDQAGRRAAVAPLATRPSTSLGFAASPQALHSSGRTAR